MNEAFAVLSVIACSLVSLALPIVAVVMASQARARALAAEREVRDLQDALFGVRREMQDRSAALQGQVQALQTALGRLLAQQAAAALAPAPAKPAAEAPKALPQPAPDAPEPEEEPSLAPNLWAGMEEAEEGRRKPESPAPPPVSLAKPEPPPRRPPDPLPEPPEPAPYRPPSFERSAVWIAAAMGGSAVVLAGLYFFALAIQEGWISPATRYVMGLALGVALLGGSERLWRRYRVPAAAVAGAGVGVLYGALYAGLSLYHLMPHGLTFALMVLVTAVATGLAWRHDSLFLAVLGAVGGYMTPILLSTGENRAIALFSYVGLLNAGLLLVAMRKGWISLIALAGAATLSLQLGWAARFHQADQAPIALCAALGLALLFALAARWPKTEVGTATAALIAGLAVGGMGPLPFLGPVGSSDGLPADMAHPAAMAAAFLVAFAALGQWAATRREQSFLAGIAGASPFLALLIFAAGWADAAEPPRDLILAGLLLPPLAGLALSLPRFPTLGALALLGAAAVAGLATLPFDGLETTEGLALVGPFVAQVAGIALLGALLAVRAPAGAALLIALGHSAVALLWALVQWEGVGGTLLVVGGALYLLYLIFPFLRRLAGSDPGEIPWLVSALAGPALFLPLYSGWEETIGEAGIGLLPLAMGALSLAGAAALVRRWQVAADDHKLALFGAVTLLFAAGAVPLQLEKEWLTIGWALECLALAWLAERVPHPLLRPTAVALGAVVAARLLVNPDALDYHEIVGPVIFNWLLYTWGVPAVALLLAAGRLKTWSAPAATFLLLAGVMLLFALLNLQIAHAFAQGGELSFRSDDLAEEMTRSLSWAAFGIALLLVGIFRRAKLLRIVAFGFLLLAAGKVFLLDLWNLQGLARVGSIMGLGVFLLLAALLFQRVVLREEEEEEDEEKAA